MRANRTHALGICWLVTVVALTAGCQPKAAVAPRDGGQGPPGPKVLADELVPVAQSGGGTFDLPLGDPAQMALLQGKGLDPGPRIELVSPREGETLATGRVEVKYRVENYDIGPEPDPGQHVHVVLDNQPYLADYDPEGSKVFEDLEPGTHTLVVFLARKFHLSLKTPDAVAIATFHVGRQDPEQVPGPDTPMLIYSRPKGTYTVDDGSAENIMCDFYLLNCTLSADGYRVRVYVDGELRHTLTTWEPLILLTNPEPGDYEVWLELVDANGQVVDTPLNGATRTVTIE